MGRPCDRCGKREGEMHGYLQWLCRPCFRILDDENVVESAQKFRKIVREICDP